MVRAGKDPDRPAAPGEHLAFACGITVEKLTYLRSKPCRDIASSWFLDQAGFVGKWFDLAAQPRDVAIERTIE